MATLSKAVLLSLLSCFLLSISGCSSPSSTPSGCAVDENTCEEGKNEAEILSEDFEPMSFEEAIAFFEDHQSGLLYFGFPGCPWCQEVVPILHKLASQANVPVHYIQTRDQEGIRLYTDLQRDEIAPYLQDYIRNNASGDPTLYVPLVVAVKEGKVVSGHQGTVSGHNAHEQEMTTPQKQEVKEDLTQLIALVQAKQE